VFFQPAGEISRVAVLPIWRQHAGFLLLAERTFSGADSLLFWRGGCWWGI